MKVFFEGGHFYQEFFDEVITGEELGLASVWLEEHHGVKNHYWPSPLIGLAGVANHTDQILLGTDILVMPFYHPVRLAEDAAMLDIIANGRLIVGAAIGYKPDEFALYQVELEKRGERFAEALSLMKELWTKDEFTFTGQHYQVPGLKIEPKPVQQPHPPIWIGGWGKLSLGRAANIGDAWVPGPTARLEKLVEAQEFYKASLASLGIDPASRAHPLTREVVIAENDALAKEMAEKHFILIEYGLESVYHKSLTFINRGHDYATFQRAVNMTKGRGIHIGAHLIAGFPTETRQEMLITSTARPATGRRRLPR